MTKIYEQHDKAFAHVSASVALSDSQQIRIAFKFPRDGAGRLYCYLHFLGVQMARGHAGGYGYDKQRAAFESALGNIKRSDVCFDWDDVKPEIDRVRQAFTDNGGADWRDVLRDCGYTVHTVV